LPSYSRWMVVVMALRSHHGEIHFVVLFIATIGALGVE